MVGLRTKPGLELLVSRLPEAEGVHVREVPEGDLLVLGEVAVVVVHLLLVAKARAPAKQKPRVRLMAKDGVIWVKPLCRLGYEGKGDP